MPTREEEIAWAAGLFDGEGTITLSGGETLAVRLCNTDEELIRRFERIIQGGHVYGRYSRQERDGFQRRPLWIWLAREEQGLDALALMWSWLSQRRRRRARELTGIPFHVFFRVAKEFLVEPNPAHPEPPQPAAAA